MENMKIYNDVCGKGKEIFINVSNQYEYNSIINGCNVDGTKMYAVGSNTWRGFHKKDKNTAGSKEVFTSYFTKNKKIIIDELKKISNENELDIFEDKICNDIREELKKYIKEDMLKSYNKIRKPIDLYIEHIVSMSDVFTDADRERISELLFLPLDSQMFSSEYIFSAQELYRNNISRTSSFKDVYVKKNYLELQKILKLKAENISEKTNMKFKRIYFDLFWNERYKKNGSNLFETNL